MFQVKDKNQNGSDKSSLQAATLIAPGTVLKGDIECANDLRIDGRVQGNISCAARVIIGPEGRVEGNITGANADISGVVTGDVTVTELLQLKDKSHLSGNISAAHLQVAPQATFNGRCQMTAVAPVISFNEKEEALARAK